MEVICFAEDLQKSKEIIWASYKGFFTYISRDCFSFTHSSFIKECLIAVVILAFWGKLRLSAAQFKCGNTVHSPICQTPSCPSKLEISKCDGNITHWDASDRVPTTIQGVRSWESKPQPVPCSFLYGSGRLRTDGAAEAYWPSSIEDYASGVFTSRLLQKPWQKQVRKSYGGYLKAGVTFPEHLRLWADFLFDDSQQQPLSTDLTLRIVLKRATSAMMPYIENLSAAKWRNISH